MSRRALIPAGQAAAISSIIRMRRSASSNGARRFGEVARIRRIPDKARRIILGAAGRVQAGGRCAPG